MDDYTLAIEKIRARKKAMGLTYLKLQGLTGYSGNALARLLTGRNCSLSMFFDVCKVLGIEVRII